MVKTNFSMAMALALCMVLCAGFSEIHPLYNGVLVKHSVLLLYIKGTSLKIKSQAVL